MLHRALCCPFMNDGLLVLTLCWSSRIIKSVSRTEALTMLELALTMLELVLRMLPLKMQPKLALIELELRLADADGLGADRVLGAEGLGAEGLGLRSATKLRPPGSVLMGTLVA